MATLDIDRLLLLDGSNEDIILAIMADLLTLKDPIGSHGRAGVC